MPNRRERRAREAIEGSNGRVLGRMRSKIRKLAAQGAAIITDELEDISDVHHAAEIWTKKARDEFGIREPLVCYAKPEDGVIRVLVCTRAGAMRVARKQRLADQLRDVRALEQGELGVFFAAQDGDESFTIYPEAA